MKAHEETWTADRNYVTSHNGQQIIGSMSDDRALLAAAAPEMARALLELHAAISSRTLDEDGALEFITRALTKAGVPLP